MENFIKLLSKIPFSVLSFLAFVLCVLVFYETGRVFKGSKAAFDKEKADAAAAIPVVEDLDD